MTLWRFSVREIVSRPGRALLTLMSIAIGVSTVVAVQMGVSATREAYDRAFTSMTGAAAWKITGQGGRRFDSDVIKDLDKLQGVKAVVPSVSLNAIVYQDDARVNATVFGIDPARESAVREYRVVEGRLFNESSTEREVVLGAALAKRLNVKSGGEIKLLSRGGVKTLPVVGIIEGVGVAGFQGGILVVTGIKTAQSLGNAGDKITTADIVVTDRAQEEPVAALLRERLPDTVVLERAATRNAAGNELLQLTENGLAVTSAFTVILAVFISLNTFLMNVCERRKQLSMLRTIGATRGQIRSILLIEGVGFGLAGTLVGVPASLIGAFMLTQMLEKTFSIELPLPLPGATTIAIAVALGLVVSLAATAYPAWKVGKISPLEGVSGATADRGARWPMGVLGLIGVIAAFIMIFGSSYNWVPQEAGAPGRGLLLVSLSLILVACIRPICQAGYLLISKVGGISARLANDELQRNPTRTGLTACVFFLASAIAIALGSTTLDIIRDIQTWYSRTITSDFIVRASMPNMGDNPGVNPEMDTEFGDSLAQLDGVASIDRARFVKIQVGEQGKETRSVMVARDFGGYDKPPLDIRDGDPAEVKRKLLAGGVVVGIMLAQKQGITDSIILTGEKGTYTFPVAAIVNDYTAGGNILYIERSVAVERFGIEGADALLIRAHREKMAGLEKELERRCEERHLLLFSFQKLADEVEMLTGGVVAALWGLLVTVFGIATLGVMNNLAMNVLEQTRELALLRVIGMEQRQVRSMVTYQGILLGVVGFGLGCPAGVGMSYIDSIFSGITIGHPLDFSIRPWFLIGAAFVALIVLIVAARLPARWACQLDWRAGLNSE